MTSGDISLVLYDTTTLYFEAEEEDDLRKVGYSKERRVDPQVVVGLLVDRDGFPLEVGCFEGNRAETTTIVPIVKAFTDRHQVAEMVVVADAGMLSAKNLAELDEANLRFIVGSKVTKAPMDLASHFRWHGDAFTDGQVIDTLTPRTPRAGTRGENDPALRAEPAWDRGQHPGSWRAVWAYSAKRAARDGKTLTAQENRARAVVAGEKTARTPRFVKTTDGTTSLDESSPGQGPSTRGPQGLRHEHPRRAHARRRGHRLLPRPVARRAVLPDVEDRPARPADVPPHQGRDRGPPDDRVHRPGACPRGPEPHRPGDPQPVAPATTAALSDHRDQRRDPDHPPHHQRPTASAPRRPQAAHELTH